jgi:hypothetical protein
MGWLFILVPLAVIVAVVVYYQRQSKAREAASQERFKALLSSVRQGAQSGQPGAVPASAASAKSADATVQRSAEFLARPLLMPPRSSLVYYLLKSSLPQSEILAQVSLGALLEVAPGSTGFECEARETRLAARVDFVVCDAGFKVLAVVNASGNKPALRSCCEGAGVRWVDVDAEALPAQEQLRDWVIGHKYNKNN